MSKIKSGSFSTDENGHDRKQFIVSQACKISAVFGTLVPALFVYSYQTPDSRGLFFLITLPCIYFFAVSIIYSMKQYIFRIYYHIFKKYEKLIWPKKAIVYTTLSYFCSVFIFHVLLVAFFVFVYLISPFVTIGSIVSPGYAVSFLEFVSSTAKSLMWTMLFALPNIIVFSATIIFYEMPNSKRTITTLP